MREGCLTRYEEALSSPCIFKVPRSAHPKNFFRRSLQVSPQRSHSTLLFTRFHTSSEPQRCRFTVSKSQNISIPDWHTIDMSQAKTEEAAKWSSRGITGASKTRMGSGPICELRRIKQNGPTMQQVRIPFSG